MRAIPQTFEDVMDTNHVPYVLFVSLAFDEPLYVCSAGYTMTWGGIEWMGLGQLGAIDAITEQSTLEATTLNLILTGVPSDMVAIALGEQYQGRGCSIYFGALNEDLSLIDTPVRIFAGRIDTMIAEVGDTASITVSVESRLVSWERARVRRYNHGDQIAQYPDDKGMEFVAQMVEKELKWG